jgi:hypothetical protein
VAGDLRKIDPRLAALSWLGMHNHAYLWLHPGGRWSAKHVAAEFAEIFLEGTSH